MSKRARVLVTTAVAVVAVLGLAAPALARTVKLYQGTSSLAGSFKTATSKVVVLEKHQRRVGDVRKAGKTWQVYQSASRLGEVRAQGGKWVVYRGRSHRVGEVRRQGSKFIVYLGSVTRVGEARGASKADAGFVAGAALLLLL
jgi:hypothetical protein